MLLVAIYTFFFGRTMSMEKGKGSNKVLYRDALAQGQRPIHFTGFRQERLSFHTYNCTRASSLKPLSQTLCGPLDLISGINNLFEIHALISLIIPPS